VYIIYICLIISSFIYLFCQYRSLNSHLLGRLSTTWPPIHSNRMDTRKTSTTCLKYSSGHSWIQWIHKWFDKTTALSLALCTLLKIFFDYSGCFLLLHNFMTAVYISVRSVLLVWIRFVLNPNITLSSVDIFIPLILPSHEYRNSTIV
jgi:hypothetical protein